MDQFLSSVSTVIYNIFTRTNIRDVLDIIIVTYVLYQALKLTRETRANSVLKGLGVLLLLSWGSSMLGLSALSFLMRQIISMGAIMFVVLFQPELRRGLEQLGRGKLILTPTRRFSAQDERARIVSELTRALLNMSKRRVGALIVLQNRTGLKDVVESGTLIDGRISARLLENIFEPNTPLHDGAVIVQGERVMAAGCLLPLSENKGISRDLGTRHRAALGLSETTDCITMIVSEETGIVSMARGGKLTRYLDETSIGVILQELYAREDVGIWRALFKGGAAK